MNISHKKKDDINAIITVDLAPEDYNPIVDKVIKDQAKKAKLPGFRPGMVPVNHIRRTFGRSILLDEINKIINEKISAYITEQKFEILGQPLPTDDENDSNYNWDFKDNFSFGYEIGLAPEFEIPFTAETEFTEYSIKADAATLDERITNLRRSYGKMTNPEISEDGDVLYATLKQEKEEGIQNTTSIRIESIEDAKIKKSLIGLKIDDTVKLDVKKAFKSTDLARLLGVSEEEAEALDITKFELTVNNINRLSEADLDQEFFNKLFPEGDVTTEEQFKEKVKEEIEGLFTQNATQKLRNDLYTFGIESITAEFPETFLKKWLKATNPELKDEEVEEGFADFITNLKWTLIENRIITANNLEVKYDEVLALAKERIYAQIKMYNINEELPEEELNKYAMQLLGDREQANRLFEEVKSLKVYDHLRSTIKVKSKKINYDKFEKLDQ